MGLDVAKSPPGSEIVAIARFVPGPEAYDRVLAALERVTIATHAEPGCDLVALHTGDDADRQVGVADFWRAHGDAESVRNLDRDIEGLLAKDREISWWRPRPVGDPGKNAA